MVHPLRVFIGTKHAFSSPSRLVLIKHALSQSSVFPLFFLQGVADSFTFDSISPEDIRALRSRVFFEMNAS